PTEDDLTREGIAMALDVSLAQSEEAMEQIRERFAATKRSITPANEVQALLPLGTEPIRNRLGTAPGIGKRFTNGGSLWVLPGVPRELKEMLKEEVLPSLRNHPLAQPVPLRRSVMVCGMPESELGAAIKDLMARGRNPSIGSYPRTAMVQLLLEAVDKSDGTSAEVLLERDVRAIKSRLPAGTAYDGDAPLEIEVAKLLLRTGSTLAIAESLTAGRASDLLARTPGISACLLAGFATYSNASKIQVLGVSPAIIEDYGAVSAPCAKSMAEGAKHLTGARFALSSTGIAGPGGGTTDKPVGTVYLGLSDDGGTVVKHLLIPGDREQVRERATTALLNLLRLRLLSDLAATGV
ncbi:MAG TPA: nicotinamide-nucleotide amidohydrolase family protein, partial [Planctomycetota bacterium]|nr:nicotinamide-nucleotide amidohydrolase family protein [Planctomycetota bacterium]